MRRFYKPSLWIPQHFLLTNPNLHHGLLDKLKAQTLKNGKRIYFQSADDAIIHHTIPSAEAVKILQASALRRITRNLLSQTNSASTWSSVRKQCNPRNRYSENFTSRMMTAQRLSLDLSQSLSSIKRHFLLLVMREMFAPLSLWGDRLLRECIALFGSTCVRRMRS